jgi:hypothetical protein
VPAGCRALRARTCALTATEPCSRRDYEAAATASELRGNRRASASVLRESASLLADKQARRRVAHAAVRPGSLARNLRLAGGSPTRL